MKTKYTRKASDKVNKTERPDIDELIERLIECERRLDQYDASYPMIEDETDGDAT